jgi:eight-cysteine-cluster-containing protein
MDSDGDGAHDCTDRCPWGEGQGKPCSDPPAPAPDGDGCRVGGCSSQICADHDVPTTCEWRDAYACYRTATCEGQADGACGWTRTDELAACLDAARRH